MYVHIAGCEGGHDFPNDFHGSRAWDKHHIYSGMCPPQDVVEEEVKSEGECFDTCEGHEYDNRACNYGYPGCVFGGVHSHDHLPKHPKDDRVQFSAYFRNISREEAYRLMTEFRAGGNVDYSIELVDNGSVEKASG